MGYQTEERRFGFYMRNVKLADGSVNQVTLRDVLPGQVPEFLADLRAYFGDGPVRILIGDRQTAERLRPAMLAAGCADDGATTYLAHVGPVPTADHVPGLTTEAVGETNLVDYVVTKLQGFASSDEPPPSEEVAAGVALRRAELAGEGRFRLARLEGEPAAIIGWYEGEDRYIFLLATRVPFRNRGIARYLLCQALREAYTRGARSVIINADPADTPIQLYRRLGFTDEVYWYDGYELHCWDH
jgi:ribosomal protein S18 acetylase RimI-like enzyme